MAGLAVLTLNIRFGLARDGIHAWENRKAHFPAFFQRYQPDFVCLQEVNDFQAGYFRTLLTDYACIGLRPAAPPFWQNNVIFYKKPWQCLRARHYYFSFTPTLPSRFAASCWPRQCTLGHFRSPAMDVLCVNTHFDFDPQIQLQSAGLVFDFLSGFSATLPAILTGDFNCQPASPAYQFLTCEYIPVSEYPKRPAGQLPFKDVLHPPWPGTRHNFDGKNCGQHIDWLLYRGPLRPVFAAVAQDAQAAALSDHFPVYAEFEVGS